MHIRCPHCQNPIEIVQDVALSDVSCPACGSNFSLIGEDTTTFREDGAQTLGRFDLRRRLGAGHFGTVWAARDTQLDREVAVKVPRREQMDDVDAEQFLREARAAAQLSHPNIVSVHEVGREDETLYIVSEFVHGVTMADWLTAHLPTLREAAEHCATIADALHYAHEAGVIHRDVKPSNIMIDADGRPRIMDFGLAKREAGEITMTMEGKILGTPAYMAPEQAKGTAHSADRRADVYSLGVVLFELLTGERPFRGNVRMLLHQVVNDDAPSPRKLNSRVPRDLETICVKCLEKNPDRRYQSAAALGADLGRWLRKEPIHARPVGRAQRTVRWCQRRPAIAGMLAIVVLITVLGFAGVTWQWRRAESAREDTGVALARSEANFEKAVEAVDRMLTKVASEDLRNVPQMDEVRRALLEDALKFYEGFLHEKADDPVLLAETGRAYIRIGSVRRTMGDYVEAETDYQSAIEICENLLERFSQQRSYRAMLADAYEGLGRAFLESGDLDSAESSIRRALDLRTGLVEELPSNEKHLDALSRSHNVLGIVFDQSGRIGDAESEYRTALDIDEQLHDAFPDKLSYRSGVAAMLNNLATLHSRQSRHADAEEGYRRAASIMEDLLADTPDEPDYLSSLALYKGNVGMSLDAQGKRTEAEDMYAEAFRLYERLTRDFPGTVRHRNLAALITEKRADLHWGRGRRKEAEEQLREVVAFHEQLVAQMPSDPERLDELVRVKTRLGQVVWERGRHSEGEGIYLEALADAEELLSRFPGYTRCLERLIYSWASLAEMLAGSSEEQEARQFLQRLVSERKSDLPSPQSAPMSPQRLALAALHFAVGDFEKKREHAEAAAAAYTEGMALIEELPLESIDGAQDLVAVEELLRKVRDETLGQQPQVADRAARAGIRVLMVLRERSPKQLVHSDQLAWNYHKMALVHARNGRLAEAVDALAQAVALRKTIVQGPAPMLNHHDQVKYLGDSCIELVRMYSQTGQFAEAAGAMKNYVALNSESVVHLLLYAQLLLLADMPGQYREVCSQAQERFGDSRISFNVAVVARTCALGEVDASTAKMAVELGEKAVAAAPKTAWMKYHLGRALNRAGRYEEAERHFHIALSQLPGGNAAHTYCLGIALAHQSLGEEEISQKWYLRGLDRLTQTGSGRMSTELWLETLLLHRELTQLRGRAVKTATHSWRVDGPDWKLQNCSAILEELVGDERRLPGNTTYMVRMHLRLASYLLEAGRAEESEQSVQAARELASSPHFLKDSPILSPETARAFLDPDNAKDRLFSLASLLQNCDEIEMYEDLSISHPGADPSRDRLLQRYADVLKLLELRGAASDLARACERADELLDRFSDERLTDSVIRISLGKYYLKLAETHEAAQRHEWALQAYRRVVDLLETLAKDDTDAPRRLSKAYNSLELALHKDGSANEREVALRWKVKALGQLAAMQPEDDSVAWKWAQSIGALGNTLTATRRLKEAEIAHRLSCQERERLAGSSPMDNGRYTILAWGQHNYGLALRRISRLEEAENYLRRAIGSRKKAIALAPENSNKQGNLVWTLVEMADTLRLAARFDEAEDFAKQAIAVLEELAAQHDEEHGFVIRLANQHVQLAQIHVEANRIEEAGKELAKAVELAPGRHEHALTQAALHLFANEHGKYRSACSAMRERFRASDDPDRTCAVIAAFTLNSEEAAAGARDLLDLVEENEAIESEPRTAWREYVVGMAHLRTEQYAEAIKLFGKSQAMEPGWHAQYLNLLGLAIAQHRMGKTSEALETYESALQWIATHPQAFRQDFQLWLEGKLRRDEAAELLGKLDSK